MTEHDAGNELDGCCCRTAAASAGRGPARPREWLVVRWRAARRRERSALSLERIPPDERPNDQPPEGWLVAQAKARHGVLAGADNWIGAPYCSFWWD